MGATNETVAYLLDLLAPLGAVRAKKMFGGYGFYRDDVMFGLIADEVFYLKADDGNRADFEAQGLPPFVYYKQGKPYTMSYYRPPAEALEDGEELCRWARKSYEAARRGARKRR